MRSACLNVRKDLFVNVARGLRATLSWMSLFVQLALITRGGRHKCPAAWSVFLFYFLLLTITLQAMSNSNCTSEATWIWKTKHFSFPSSKKKKKTQNTPSDLHVPQLGVQSPGLFFIPAPCQVQLPTQVPDSESNPVCGLCSSRNHQLLAERPTTC